MGSKMALQPGPTICGYNSSINLPFIFDFVMNDINRCVIAVGIGYRELWTQNLTS